MHLLSVDSYFIEFAKLLHEKYHILKKNKKNII